MRHVGWINQTDMAVFILSSEGSYELIVVRTCSFAVQVRFPSSDPGGGHTRVTWCLL